MELDQIFHALETLMTVSELLDLLVLFSQINFNGFWLNLSGNFTVS